MLADSLIDKYLVGANRRDFNSMIPGLTDVCDHVATVIDKLQQNNLINNIIARCWE